MPQSRGRSRRSSLADLQREDGPARSAFVVDPGAVVLHRRQVVIESPGLNPHRLVIALQALHEEARARSAPDHVLVGAQALPDEGAQGNYWFVIFGGGTVRVSHWSLLVRFW